MREIKVGLIGLGFMGTTHYGIYRNLPGVKVTAIADVDPAKRRGDVSKVVGNIGGGDNSQTLNQEGIAIYEDARKLIAEADTDVIDICVPTPDHASLVLLALAAKKHVFCEKPLCRNLEQLKEIRHAVQESKNYFNVGMCIRAWPEYVHAKNLLDSGEVGAVKTALFRRLSPDISGNSWQNWFMEEQRSGGAILDLHLHDTDAVCYFFGRPKSVRSCGVRGVVSDHGIDHVITNYTYPDGKFVTAEGGWCAAKTVPFEMSFQIVCEKATLKLDASGYHIYWNCGRVETPELNSGALPTGWHVELDYFIRCVRDRIIPDKYQTPDSIFDAVTVVMAEMESVDFGKAVEVEYV